MFSFLIYTCHVVTQNFNNYNYPGVPLFMIYCYVSAVFIDIMGSVSEECTSYQSPDLSGLVIVAI